MCRSRLCAAPLMRRAAYMRAACRAPYVRVGVLMLLGPYVLGPYVLSSYVLNSYVLNSLLS